MNRVMIIGAGLLLGASTALAQPAGDAGVAGGAGEPTAGAGGWVLLDERPLVIPEGKLEVHGGLPIMTLGSVDAMGKSTSDTGEALSIGGSYGAADKLEVGGDYAFRVHPNASAKGIGSFHGAYAAMKTDTMELAVAGALNLELFGIDAKGNSVTNLGIDLGAWFRYQVVPKISIFTGQPALPFTLGDFSTFRAPPLGYQLSVGLDHSRPMVFSLPVGAGFQATPNLYAFASFDLADIYLSNAPVDAMGNKKRANVIFSDFIPLGVGAWYTANEALELGVNFSDDLKNAGDIYLFTLAGRYYVK